MSYVNDTLLMAEGRIKIGNLHLAINDLNYCIRIAGNTI